MTLSGHARRHEAPELYSWSTSVGPGGVTTDKSVAVHNVHAVLADADPGATGAVDRVRLETTRPRYVYLARVAHAWCDEASGRVAWAVGDGVWLTGGSAQGA